MTEHQYWAEFKRIRLGPFPSREAAIVAMQAYIKAKKVPLEYGKEIVTGYGAKGPHFDIRWKRPND